MNCLPRGSWNRQQGFQLGPLYVGQSCRELTIDLSLGTPMRFPTEPLNRRECWDDDLARSHFFDEGGNENSSRICLASERQEPDGQFPVLTPGKGPKPTDAFEFCKMFIAGGLAVLSVLDNAHRIELE